MTKNKEWLSNQGKSCKLYVDTAILLAKSHGMYGRIINQINEMSEDELSCLAQDLQKENFMDMIDVIWYVES